MKLPQNKGEVRSLIGMITFLNITAFKNLLNSLWSNRDLLCNDYRAVIEKKNYVLTGSKE